MHDVSGILIILNKFNSEFYNLCVNLMRLEVNDFFSSYK